MVQKAIDKAKGLSIEENNTKKYLFNTYEGKLKGTPLSKQSFLYIMERLIEEKEIRAVNNELYHFKPHSLSHTRAKEYVEQGMGISVIQQILGHQSLQIMVHFNSVSQLSGVSKRFLCNNEEVKKRIEELPQKQTSKTINQRAKYDKTSKSKDIIIMAKDKKIKNLKKKIKNLKSS